MKEKDEREMIGKMREREGERESAQYRRDIDKITTPFLS